MGEIAGLLCAFNWSLSATCFTESSKIIGTTVVNRARLLVALLLLMITNMIMIGMPLPFNAGFERWLWLGGSGIIGLAIGDAIMFEAYIILSPRVAMLISALSPILNAVFAWLFLGESLRGMTLIGILISICGIAIVILDHSKGFGSKTNRKKFMIGILFTLLAITAYAIGNIMSKIGLAGNFNAMQGVSIRMTMAALASWIPVFFARQTIPVFKKAWSDSKATRFILIGSVLGPFLGVWFSLLSVQNTSLGISSTLISTAPIFMLPIAKWFYKENIGLMAVIGTLVTICGIMVIFLL